MSHERIASKVSQFLTFSGFVPNKVMFLITNPSAMATKATL